MTGGLRDYCSVCHNIVWVYMSMVGSMGVMAAKVREDFFVKNFGGLVLYTV